MACSGTPASRMYVWTVVIYPVVVYGGPAVKVQEERVRLYLHHRSHADQNRVTLVYCLNFHTYLKGMGRSLKNGSDSLVNLDSYHKIWHYNIFTEERPLSLSQIKWSIMWVNYFYLALVNNQNIGNNWRYNEYKNKIHHKYMYLKSPVLRIKVNIDSSVDEIMTGRGLIVNNYLFGGMGGFSFRTKQSTTYTP